LPIGFAPTEHLPQRSKRYASDADSKHRI
jgi:hypothetical protein